MKQYVCPYHHVITDEYEMTRDIVTDWDNRHKGLVLGDGNYNHQPLSHDCRDWPPHILDPLLKSMNNFAEQHGLPFTLLASACHYNLATGRWSVLVRIGVIRAVNGPKVLNDLIT